MSHFTVLVIGDDWEAQLAPYDMAIETDSYLDEDGELWMYNPIGQYDWYAVGGRWRGSVLRVKPTVVAHTSEYGGPSHIEPKVSYADICRKGDVDWEKMADDADRAARHSWRSVHAVINECPPVIPWPMFVARHASGDISIDEAREEYHAQPAVAALQRSSDPRLEGHRYSDVEDFLCSEDEYAQRAAASSGITHALVKDGQWYQHGEMLWGGQVADEMTEDEWNRRVRELINGLPDDTLLTVVDCHC